LFVVQATVYKRDIALLQKHVILWHHQVSRLSYGN